MATKLKVLQSNCKILVQQNVQIKAAAAAAAAAASAAAAAAAASATAAVEKTASEAAAKNETRKNLRCVFGCAYTHLFYGGICI